MYSKFYLKLINVLHSTFLLLAKKTIPFSPKVKKELPVFACLVLFVFYAFFEQTQSPICSFSLSSIILFTGFIRFLGFWFLTSLDF